ncbi:MAG: hypothetical protein KF868_22140, partial [Acidobacteria bacterium]|nr:hypothetical protein [Acidobacteriota bacterium]
LGNGFMLTNAANGVHFDLDSNGVPERLSWTAWGADDSWLAWDKNMNGVIDNGTELFGNYTSQPSSKHPNGFEALAQYDKLEFGGNEDGKISAEDSIYSSLRLWRDVNHNGLTDPLELLPLEQVGLIAIDLDYRESKRVDVFGNRFVYRARIRNSNNTHIGRWAWDVFLLRG